MKLSEILKDILFSYTIEGEEEREVKDIFYDSRKVKKNSLFVALRGFQKDGHQFLSEAAKKGAVAFLVEEKKNISHSKNTQIIVPSTRLAFPFIVSSFYGHPDKEMDIIGITGTNGKTTLTYLLEGILSEEGIQVAVSGTIKQRFGKLESNPGLTTPEAKEIFSFLSKVKNKGADVVAMEVSSHALATKRVESIQFSHGFFTNLTHDHLDFHRNMEEYKKAKLHLFDLVKEEGIAVVNLENHYGQDFAQYAASKGLKVVTCGIEKGDYQVKLLSTSWQGIEFKIEKTGAKFFLPLLGEHNLLNALQSLALGYELEIKEDTMRRGLEKVVKIPGRLDKIEVNGKRGVKVIIDYAHTPEAMRNVLSALKKLPHNRLITLFGCGGNRDREKRPLMGEIACQMSDFVFLTSDNPREEDPKRIILDILVGVKRTGKENYLMLEKREKAIQKAVEMLDKGDLLAILGKGHEDYQIIGMKKCPFSDHKVVGHYLEERFGKLNNNK